MSLDLSDDIHEQGVLWRTDYDKHFTAKLDSGEEVAVDSEGFGFADIISRVQEEATTDAQNNPKSVLESAYPNFNKNTRVRAQKALMAKKTVGFLVAAAVSDNSEAVGRVADGLITSVEHDTGPLRLPQLEGEPQSIQATKVVAELAEEVKSVATEQSIQILKDKVAEQKRLIDTEKQDLAEQNTRLQQENRRLTRELEEVRRNSLDAIAAKQAHIELLSDQLAEDNQSDATEQIQAVEPEVSPAPLQRRKLLGIGSVGVAFRHHFSRPSTN